MPHDDDWNERHRDESGPERADRNYGELLQELRVAETGVQILFAFLLTLPFSQRFAQTTAFHRADYAVTLFLAAMSSALLIAAVPYHRLLFRLHGKEQLVRATNWMTIGGLACLCVAVVGTLLLVTDFLFGHAVAAVTCAPMAVVFLVLWWLVPLRQRRLAERARQ